MATVDRYRVEIDTAGANSALKGLKSNITGIGAAIAGAFTVKELTNVAARFQDLRTSLGFLYKDTIKGAEAFEQIKTFATESVFSVNDLTQSVVKLKAAGLDPTIKQLKLFADVASVTTDQVGALQAITDLYARTTAGGLGLEDLNRLQDRGIPVFKMLKDSVGLARDEISKVGQSAEGAQAILAVLGAELEKVYGGASAAKAQNLSQAISNLGDAFDNMFDTIGVSGFNDALRDSINAITDFIGRNKALIVAIGEGLGAAIRFAADNIKIFAAILAGAFSYATAGIILKMAAAVFEFAKGLRQAAVAGAVLQGVTGIGLAKVLAGLAGASGAVLAINELVGDGSDNIEKLNGELEKLKGQTGPLSGATDPNAQANYNKALETINNIKMGTALSVKNGQDYVATVKASTEEFQRQIKQQRELVGLTDQQTEAQRLINDFNDIFVKKLDELKAKKAEILKQNEVDQNLLAAIEAQIKGVTDEHNKMLPVITAQVNELTKAQETAEKYKQSMEDVKKAAEDTKDFIADLRQSTADMQFDLQTANMNELEKQIATISRDINKKVGTEITRLKKLLKETDDPVLRQQIQKQISDIQAAANEAVQTQAKLAEQSYRHQRSFAYGWSQAFKEYRDNATNAAKTAERIFSKATSGMEDLIVDFAKTGKFEWKGFVSSMLEELLRSQIQIIFANLMGSMQDSFGGTGSSGGGLLDTIGNLFGFGSSSSAGRGSSANNPLYVQQVGTGSGSIFGNTGQGSAGGTGGSIFDSISNTVGKVWQGVKDVGSGIWDTVSSIGSSIGGGISNVVSGISNIFGGSGSGGGGFFDGISKTIGSIASGIGDFFGGFFANGGTLGAGKWGIAGENGPELIRGPASVSPMGGANVTYNINAVDAMSFKQLVAADPAFIYGVTMQGAKGIPARR